MSRGVYVLDNGRRVEFHIQFYYRGEEKVVTSTPTTCSLHGWTFSIEASDSYIDFTDQDIEILQDAYKAMNKEGSETLNKSFDTGVASNWPGWNSPNPGGIFCAPITHGSTSMLVGFAVAGFVYGLVHLLAWNAPFHTKTEQLLWRISGCILAGSGLVIPLLEFASSIIEGFGECCSGVALLFFMLVASPAFICVAVLYVVARVYLIVECFISLTHLPDDAFKVPIWSQYVLHLT